MFLSFKNSVSINRINPVIVEKPLSSAYTRSLLYKFGRSLNVIRLNNIYCVFYAAKIRLFIIDSK